MVRSVVIAGGGTGGHIEPAMALADALRRLDPEIRITCLGTERGLETKIIPARGYALDLIPAVPLPRSLTPALLSVPARMAAAVGAAAQVLDRAEATVLVGFGGYVATPGYLAAMRRRVPIVVHEANARPGLANRIGSRLTRHVFTGQRGTRLPHATFIGIPIRNEIATLDRLDLSDRARAHFGLRPDLPVLLVTGGSQGAASLNSAVIAAAELLLSAGVQVLHIVGPRSGARPSMPRGSVPYVMLEYLDRMDLAYAAADFALCRAGAMTCAELTAVGLPAAYVPLPHGNGEQRLNAMPIERAGGGMIVDDASLSPEWIRTVLLRVLLDHERVAYMSRAAAGVGSRDADEALAAEVIAVADAGRSRKRAGQRERAASGRSGRARPGSRYPGPAPVGPGYPETERGRPDYGADYTQPGYPGPGPRGTGHQGPGYASTGFPGPGYPETGPRGPGYAEPGHPGASYARPTDPGYPGSGYAGSDSRSREYPPAAHGGPESRPAEYLAPGYGAPEQPREYPTSEYGYRGPEQPREYPAPEYGYRGPEQPREYLAPGYGGPESRAPEYPAGGYPGPHAEAAGYPGHSYSKPDRYEPPGQRRPEPAGRGYPEAGYDDHGRWETRPPETRPPEARRSDTGYPDQDSHPAPGNTGPARGSRHRGSHRGR